MKHYFAYGTLLDVDAMRAFAPSARPEGVLRLDGYEMAFGETRQPGKGGCFLRARPGAVTYGIHYALSDDDMARMDVASGVHDGLWVHQAIEARDPEGRAVSTVTYTIPGDPPPFRPGADYVGKILKGLSKLDVPRGYVARIEAMIAGIEVRPIDPRSPLGLELFAESSQEQIKRYGRDGGRSVDELARDALVFVAALVDGAPAGCGAVVALEPGVGELSRIFVRESARRRGVGRAIMAVLEDAVRDRVGRLVLETGTAQQESMRLYEACGYRPIPCWGKSVDNPRSRCYEKRLA
ncbi:MAG TPA: GNAT family N-acetyltransferase [Burkholderiaceae bacterium]|nr:GNAT family N-acetyltransferase [Burkholderiaceae bacterium]